MIHAYPRIYRANGSGRALYLGLGGLVVALSVLGLVFFVLLSDEPVSAQMTFVIVCGAFAVLGAYLIVGGLRTRVVLEAHAIELHGVFSTKRLNRDDIAGRRRVPQQYGAPAIRLLPRHADQKAILLHPYFATDAAFDAWLAQIPDIDAEEGRASLDAILNDDDLQGSRDEKLAALARARHIAKILMTITFTVGAWVWFYPHPYDLATASTAALPWIAVWFAARGGRLYRLNPSRNEAGADVSLPFFLPGLVLALRAMFDMHIFDVEKMLILTIAASAVCMLIVWWAVRELRSNPKSVLLLGALMSAYAFGFTALANMAFDRGQPESFEAKVLDSRVSSGKTTTYYLKLGPWGPRTEAEDVDVDRAYYNRASGNGTPSGETVCVYLFRGALGVRWFEVWDCPRE